MESGLIKGDSVIVTRAVPFAAAQLLSNSSLSVGDILDFRVDGNAYTHFIGRDGSRWCLHTSEFRKLSPLEQLANALGEDQLEQVQ